MTPESVLVVTASYPGVEAPYNGVFIREHAMAFAREGVHSVVLAPRVFRADAVSHADGPVRVERFRFLSGQRLLVEYERIPYVRMASYLLSGAVRACRLARRERPSVVHAHWVVPTGLIGVAAARCSRRPLVVTAHRADVEVALRSSVVRRLAKFVLRRAGHVVAVSHALRETLVADLDLDPARVSVVPMGVDRTLFAPSDMVEARLGLGLPKDARVVLFVGGLTEVKGVRYLLEALPSVLALSPGALLLLAGEGPLLDRLARAAEESGVAESVRFLGALAHDEVPRAMNAADVLVLPSLSEGLPVCLMEAAAVGLPVVATDVGGNAEVVALNPASRLVVPGDAPALASALVGALGDVSSGPRTSDLGEGHAFDQRTCVRGLLGIYARVGASRDDRRGQGDIG